MGLLSHIYESMLYVRARAGLIIAAICSLVVSIIFSISPAYAFFSSPADDGHWYFSNPSAIPCNIPPNNLRDAGFLLGSATYIGGQSMAHLNQNTVAKSEYEAAYLETLHDLFTDETDESGCGWVSPVDPGNNLQIFIFHWTSSDGPGEADAVRMASKVLMEQENEKRIALHGRRAHISPLEDFVKTMGENKMHFTTGFLGCTLTSELGLFAITQKHNCQDLAKLIASVRGD